MSSNDVMRVRARIRGSVQGVGFRPHVYRLATDLGLRGWVCNSPEGVEIDTEGGADDVRSFLELLAEDLPPLASIRMLEREDLAPAGYTAFEIRPSVDGTRRAEILPDAATCPDCLRDLREDPRRLFYPFTNCTNCGPRFSIIRALPYDRERTTMAGFVMCGACTREYADPLDRRFHAQPNACHDCGPEVELWRDGAAVALKEDAISAAAALISNGAIVAVKGLGGFHLTTTALDADAVGRLRARKAREEKPLAVMVRSVDEARLFCEITSTEETLLRSPGAPIVLVAVRPGQHVIPVQSVAPGMDELGIMLPYTPLHHILLERIGGPIIATSGNISDEPICVDNSEALARLDHIADAFLIHDRPIERAVEDSVTRVVLGRELPIRRSRGYAPHPVILPEKCAGPPALAVGAHQKCTVALRVGNEAFVSQHLGDLSTLLASQAFEKAVRDLPQLYGVEPEIVVRDLHPDYASSRWADDSGIPVVKVQHHVAHAFGCLAENDVKGPALAVAWDGTGLGTDGSIWGGEFFYVSDAEVVRIAHLRPFDLVGGEKASREPRRSAAGVLDQLHHSGGSRLWSSFSTEERPVIEQMLHGAVGLTATTSVGRLFDAAASLVGLRGVTSFEGQAAMEFEHLARSATDAGFAPSGRPRYHVELEPGLPMVVDWRPAVSAILDDVERDTDPAVIAAGFHAALADVIVQVAVSTGRRIPVALTGGCFQNRLLTELAVRSMADRGYKAVLHHRLPPNDGGLSYGQLAAAASEAARAAGFVDFMHGGG